MEERLREQVGAGVHGIMVGNVSGEYVNLRAEERERLVRDTAAAVRGPCPVVAGILEPHIRAAVQAAVRAEAAGRGTPASTWTTGPSPSWPRCRASSA